MPRGPVHPAHGCMTFSPDDARFPLADNKFVASGRKDQRTERKKYDRKTLEAYEEVQKSTTSCARKS